MTISNALACAALSLGIAAATIPAAHAMDNMMKKDSMSMSKKGGMMKKDGMKKHKGGMMKSDSMGKEDAPAQ